MFSLFMINYLFVNDVIMLSYYYIKKCQNLKSFIYCFYVLVFCVQEILILVHAGNDANQPCFHFKA